ncbi:MAG: DUF1549 domain-containing protein [Planctomycetales bacterium]|nr:DUF1549 domain-containing protein [Planctomycetales bacterium]
MSIADRTVRHQATRWLLVALILSGVIPLRAGDVAPVDPAMAAFGGDVAVTRRASVDFARDLIPALTKAGCNAGACHGAFQGRGGFQLSLLGFDPAADRDTLIKASRGRRVSPSVPLASLLLRKATATMPHGGGRRISVESEVYRLLHDYIALGMPAPSAEAPRIVGLNVTPTSVVLEPQAVSQLCVNARWSDGNSTDVTSWALFDSRDGSIAEVSRTGRVIAIRSGQSPVTVRYLGQVASVGLTVPFPRGVSLHSQGGAANSAFVPANYIDELVLAKWRELRLQPAPLASDSEFLRRPYLDLIGTLPTPDEVREFLASTEPNKRSKLIDRLLDRPEFVDHWSVKWGDLLRVHRRYVGDKGLGSFWSWVQQSVRENKPVDKLVRELLTAQGNVFSSGPAAYYFVDQKPEELAETTAQVFLGVRLQCTKCHHHPFESWSQDDYFGLAAFFTRLDVKENNENGLQGRFGGARSIRPIATESPKRKLTVVATPHWFGSPPPDLDGVADVRTLLADWITRPDNPYFARNFSNRFWAYLMGRGLVEALDDHRATNPASNPALLDALARDFTEHHFDVKHLLRTICNSRVYQLASEFDVVRRGSPDPAVPDRRSPEDSGDLRSSDGLGQETKPQPRQETKPQPATKAQPPDAEGEFFTHRVPRRIPAEVLLDAVNQATESREAFAGLPAGTRAISLPDPAVPSYFLTAFGRPLRNSPCECARTSQPDLTQALHLVNSPAIHQKVVAETGRVARLLKASRSDADLIEELYLATLSRLPTPAERQTITELLAEAPSKKEGFEDLLWTLLNSSEFVFNH